MASAAPWDAPVGVSLSWTWFTGSQNGRPGVRDELIWIQHCLRGVFNARLRGEYEVICSMFEQTKVTAAGSKKKPDPEDRASSPTEDRPSVKLFSIHFTTEDPLHLYLVYPENVVGVGVGMSSMLSRTSTLKLSSSRTITGVEYSVGDFLVRAGGVTSGQGKLHQQCWLEIQYPPCGGVRDVGPVQEFGTTILRLLHQNTPKTVLQKILLQRDGPLTSGRRSGQQQQDHGVKQEKEEEEEEERSEMEMETEEEESSGGGGGGESSAEVSAASSPASRMPAAAGGAAGVRPSVVMMSPNVRTSASDQRMILFERFHLGKQIHSRKHIAVQYAQLLFSPGLL